MRYRAQKVGGVEGMEIVHLTLTSEEVEEFKHNEALRHIAIIWSREDTQQQQAQQEEQEEQEVQAIISSSDMALTLLTLAQKKYRCTNTLKSESITRLINELDQLYYNRYGFRVLEHAEGIGKIDIDTGTCLINMSCTMEVKDQVKILKTLKKNKIKLI